MINIFMITDPKSTDGLTQFYVDVKQKERELRSSCGTAQQPTTTTLTCGPLPSIPYATLQDSQEQGIIMLS